MYHTHHPIQQVILGILNVSYLWRRVYTLLFTLLRSCFLYFFSVNVAEVNSNYRDNIGDLYSSDYLLENVCYYELLTITSG